MESTGLIDRVRNTIEHHQLLQVGETVVVGVSGGPDSLCLLHLLMRLQQAYALRLHVAHMNHCLRGAESEGDAAFVARQAAEWRLPATIESQNVAAVAATRNQSIEEAARQVRYAFLARVARSVGAHKIAVGHNADDQVETVVMHWLRGSGLAGLRGMLFATKLDSLRLEGADCDAGAEHDPPLVIRPLLDTRRTEIEQYCAALGLQPRFDRSNLDTTYYRNRLRHELIPLLETFNPRIREVILRSTKIIAADYALLRTEAAGAWAQAVVDERPQAIEFNLEKWRSLPLSLQRSVLREAIHRLRRSLRNINWVHVEDAVRVLQVANTGAAVTLPRGLEIRVGYDRFLMADREYTEPPPDLPWVQRQLQVTVPGKTALPDSDWCLDVDLRERAALDQDEIRDTGPLQAFLDYGRTGAELWLRPRRTGDRFWPQGLGEKPTTVHNFMINAKIPRAWREQVPLLASPHQVLWIPGWRIDERVKVTAETSQVLALSFAKAAEA